MVNNCTYSHLLAGDSKGDAPGGMPAERRHLKGALLFADPANDIDPLPGDREVTAKEDRWGAAFYALLLGDANILHLS